MFGTETRMANAMSMGLFELQITGNGLNGRIGTGGIDVSGFLFDAASLGWEALRDRNTPPPVVTDAARRMAEEERKNDVVLEEVIKQELTPDDVVPPSVTENRENDNDEVVLPPVTESRENDENRICGEYYLYFDSPYGVEIVVRMPTDERPEAGTTETEAADNRPGFWENLFAGIRDGFNRFIFGVGNFLGINRPVDPITPIAPVDPAEMQIYLLRRAAEDNLGQEYKRGENDCDIWIERVLIQAGIDPREFFAGPASDKSVEQHIAAAVERGVVPVEKRDTNINNLPEGVYVVFMGASARGFREHAGLLFVNKDGTVNLYHTTSDTDFLPEGATGPVSRIWSYKNANEFQSRLGYDLFYYQRVP